MRTMKGGRMNINEEETAKELNPKQISSNPAEMTPYYPDNNASQKKLEQTLSTPTSNTKQTLSTPTSNANLFSTKLRKLNNYPEWNKDNGIDKTIDILLSNQKQTKKFEEKYKNFFVGENNGKKELFYGIKAKGDDSENFNVLLMVVRPDNKDKIMTEIYKDDTLGLGLGITQFYYQICRKYLNITRKDATLFLKKQGDYQIALVRSHKVNTPITAKTSNERWGVDNVDMKRYKESVDGSSYIAFLTIVDYFSKKVWAVPNKDLEAKSNFEGFMSICRKENTYP